MCTTGPNRASQVHMDLFLLQREPVVAPVTWREAYVAEVESRSGLRGTSA